ncbi:hypothetical protein BU24DRAFT_356206 [Aaosphaeria arxii CBS 175.79]|uniref:Uncharacterized protein n=1 Tax=Aaosphaeria arxii CBS 175.79 TaxID=1450172 RepID=A0A6A5XBS2_9PLEO|nr:uncharacterized protein BU24DRAFT_356206 [Aaosphaeria arxii CBS 175.79]KAF2010408.1 hypothetical protein BU24DRAFT_356206 [Aaosphaeria arxii CBS 175.79]
MIWLTFFNLFLFVVSALTLICVAFTQRSPSQHHVASLMEQFGVFSPAMHMVEYTQTKFELPNPLNSSKYVGITDEVENAWMDIAYLPDQMVSMKDFPKLEKPEDSLKVTDPKTGETGYRVGLEVFHQLHCLNLLRMSTYPEYYTKLWWSDTNDKPEKVRAHLDHCIEILRMNLMCLSDVNVFTFRTIPGRESEGPWPDYESKHVCRNFDDIKKWANDNAMPDEDV